MRRLRSKRSIRRPNLDIETRQLRRIVAKKVSKEERSRLNRLKISNAERSQRAKRRSDLKSKTDVVSLFQILSNRLHQDLMLLELKLEAYCAAAKSYSLCLSQDEFLSYLGLVRCKT